MSFTNEAFADKDPAAAQKVDTLAASQYLKGKHRH